MTWKQAEINASYRYEVTYLITSSIVLLFRKNSLYDTDDKFNKNATRQKYLEEGH